MSDETGETPHVDLSGIDPNKPTAKYLISAYEAECT